MRPIVLAGAALSLGALGVAGLMIAFSGSSHGRSPGPDSARVESYLAAVRGMEPMYCEMLVDQVGNFWNSSGDFRIGLLAESNRSWEVARDSLYGATTDPAALRREVRGLDDANPCVRRAAAKLLGRSGPAGYNAIREALRSGSERVREAAALAAGQNDEAVALADDLLRATRDQNPSVVAMATWALSEFEKPEHLNRLAELARHPEVRVRRAAAHGVGHIELPARVVPALLPLLGDDDAGVRYYAASGLGNQEDARAAPQLAQLLSDRDHRVKLAAAEALGDLDDMGQQAPAVIDALGRALGDPDPEIRGAIVHALGHIEDQRVTPHLLRALKDTHPEVRKLAAEALGERK
jgi:HEAT repeat protein